MKLIYLDACLVIYEVEMHPQFQPPFRRAMTQRKNLDTQLGHSNRGKCAVPRQNRSAQ